MTKIKLISEEQADGTTLEFYKMLKSRLGKIPNVYKVYGNSGAALKANLVMDQALSEGLLSGKEIELIALIVSDFNGCEYCIAAHTMVGKMHGLEDQDLSNAISGHSENARFHALLQFTSAILHHNGKIGNDDLQAFYKQGYHEGHVVEVIGQIAKNFFNNYTNQIAGTPVDFPKPEFNVQ